MSTQPAQAVRKIVVRIKVGSDRMAATDDPVFLRLLGPSGREFRLSHARGRDLRRDADDSFVLGPSGDGETNVAHPGLNDPTVPALDLAGITGVAIHKGMEPVPNVRGFGEMDDRLEVAEASVEIHADGSPSPVRFHRAGPLWLGLLCGHSFELQRVDGE